MFKTFVQLDLDNRHRAKGWYNYQIRCLTKTLLTIPSHHFAHGVVTGTGAAVGPWQVDAECWAGTYCRRHTLIQVHTSKFAVFEIGNAPALTTRALKTPNMIRACCCRVTVPISLLAFI